MFILPQPLHQPVVKAAHFDHRHILLRGGRLVQLFAKLHHLGQAGLGERMGKWSPSQVSRLAFVARDREMFRFWRSQIVAPVRSVMDTSMVRTALAVSLREPRALLAQCGRF